MKLPMSKTAMRMQCPGSRLMCESYSTPQSEYAIEGSSAHKLIELMFKGLPVEGSNFSEEMWDGWELWYEVLKPYFGWDTCEIEKEVEWSYDGFFVCGRVDFYAYSKEKNEIVVAEYKFGHSPVRVYENWQLINNLYGIMADNLVDKARLHDLKCRFIVVQPRNYSSTDRGVQYWTTSYSALHPYFEEIKRSERGSVATHAQRRVGSECKFCSGRYVCDALRESALTALEQAYVGEPDILSDLAAGVEMRLLKRAVEIINYRLRGLEIQITEALRKGKVVPGYVLQQTTGRTVWGVSDVEIVALGELMGVPLTKPSFITPKQAVSKGIPLELVESMSTVAVGSMKLVCDDVESRKNIFKQKQP